MKTCRITFGDNFTPKRKGRPHINRYHPSRKRRLALDKRVGRKAKRQFATA